MGTVLLPFSFFFNRSFQYSDLFLNKTFLLCVQCFDPLFKWWTAKACVLTETHISSFLAAQVVVLTVLAAKRLSACFNYILVNKDIKPADQENP